MRKSHTGLIILMNCVLHAAAFAAENTTANKAQMKALLSAMDAKLKDADSAKYIDVRIGKEATDEGRAICGKVNARNSYGGYVGFQSFYGVVAADGSIRVTEIDSPQSYPTAQYKCHGLGLYVGEFAP